MLPSMIRPRVNHCTHRTVSSHANELIICKSLPQLHRFLAFFFVFPAALEIRQGMYYHSFWKNEESNDIDFRLRIFVKDYIIQF